MEYHRDRKVVFSTEREYKNLYNWSLHELDSEGKKIGRDQVLWQWSLYFTALDFTLSESLSLEGPIWAEAEAKNAISKNSENIRAKLRPGYFGHRSERTRYSMFGTGRQINDFDLTIYKLERDEEAEKCQLWGTISYTAENDSRDETTPDVLAIYLHVSPARFARYAEMIRNSSVSSAVLRLSGVSGFYSEWSPSISTNFVKVLANFEDQGLELPTDVEFKPPSLGPVSQFDITFLTTRKLQDRWAELEVQDDDDDDDDEPEKIEEPPEITSHSSPVAPDERVALQKALLLVAQHNEKTLGRLSTAIWIIVVLLLFSLGKRW